MFIGWGLFLNIGFVISRYMRRYDTRIQFLGSGLIVAVSLCSQPSWFLLHVIFQSFGILLTVAGFAFVFGHIQAEGGRHFHAIHHASAFAVFLLSVLQVLAGILARWMRVQKPVVARWHRVLGTLSVIAGIGSLATGLVHLSRGRRRPGCLLNSFLGAFALVLFLGISILEVYVKGGERWISNVQDGENQPLLAFRNSQNRARYVAIYALFTVITVVGVIFGIFYDLERV